MGNYQSHARRCMILLGKTAQLNNDLHIFAEIYDNQLLEYRGKDFANTSAFPAMRSLMVLC